MTKTEFESQIEKTVKYAAAPLQAADAMLGMFHQVIEKSNWGQEQPETGYIS